MNHLNIYGCPFPSPRDRRPFLWIAIFLSLGFAIFPGILTTATHTETNTTHAEEAPKPGFETDKFRVESLSFGLSKNREYATLSLSITNKTNDDLFLAVERDPEPRLIDDAGGLMHFDKLSGLEATNYPDKGDSTQISKNGSTIIIVIFASYDNMHGRVFSFSATFFVQQKGREDWPQVSVGLAGLRPTTPED